MSFGKIEMHSVEILL